MKHIAPGQAKAAVVDDKNIDRATATWLNQSYSGGAAVDNDGTLEVKQKSSNNNERLRQRQSLSTVIDANKINSWDLDVLDYTHEQLFEIVHYLFDSFDIFETFKVPGPVFIEFIREIAVKYIENTYHNFRHGCDVTYTVFRLLVVPGLQDVLSTLELFSIMTAALAHDVGHPGVNNVYLVKSKNKLALRHNDKSPLENMHCALLYTILSDPEKNIFIGLTDSQWRESRKVIIASILGTDMMHHFEQISKVQVSLKNSIFI